MLSHSQVFNGRYNSLIPRPYKCSPRPHVFMGWWKIVSLVPNGHETSERSGNKATMLEHGGMPYACSLKGIKTLI